MFTENFLPSQKLSTESIIQRYFINFKKIYIDRIHEKLDEIIAKISTIDTRVTAVEALKEIAKDLSACTDYHSKDVSDCKLHLYPLNSDT